jgi:hypothetical protein
VKVAGEGEESVLRKCLDERGLDLVPCGSDFLEAIVRCVHDDDPTTLDRSLRRLWADILLYTSPAHLPKNSKQRLAYPAPGEWPEDLLLEACAQVLGVTLVCYKMDVSTPKPRLFETIYAPAERILPFAAVHLALERTVAGGMEGGGGGDVAAMDDYRATNLEWEWRGGGGGGGGVTGGGGGGG